MAMQPRLDLRQTQSLVMTPQLQQAIKLLQLSNIELSSFVEEELERNPLLEREEAPADVPRQESLPEERRDADNLLVDRSDSGGSEAPMDVELDNSFDEGSPMEGPSYDPDDLTAWSRSEGSGGYDGDERSLEETLAEEINLRDHLSAQVALEFAVAADRMIGLALIDSLDEAGYLRADLDEIADGLGTTAEHVAVVLARAQRFDPAGMFARSLQECLALQLKDRNRYDPAMEALLAHLDLVARRDFNGLLKVCGVDSEDLQEMLGELRALDPKPAYRFEGAAAQPVTPDVLMRPDPEGGWIVELNPETLPRVLVNNRYYSKVSKAARSKDEKAFISENFQTASWLVKSSTNAPIPSSK
jgi:RNA polymerase sigma-54 factor